MLIRHAECLPFVRAVVVRRIGKLQVAGIAIATVMQTGSSEREGKGESWTGGGKTQTVACTSAVLADS